jgi:hypothetical protein
VAHQKERHVRGRRGFSGFDQHVGVEQIVVESLDPYPFARRFPMPAQIHRDQFDARGVQPQRERVVTPGVFGETVHERDPRDRPPVDGRRLPAMQKQFDALTRGDRAGGVGAARGSAHRMPAIFEMKP